MLTALIEKIARWYPIYRGRGRLALSALARVPGNEVVLKRLTSGQPIYVYQNDYIGRMVSLFGDLDPCVTNFVLTNVSLGDVIVDIGSNIGVITLPGAKACGDTGKVLSVEPNDAAAAVLERSLALNDLSNVEVLRKALSNFSGRAKLKVPVNDFGQAKLTEEEGADVEVVRLDDIILEDVTHVRLMKIDVEGHEAEVLGGGLKFIDRYRVDLILFESHITNGPFWERGEVRILADLGYSLYEFRRGPLLSSKLLEIYFSDTSYTPESYDFVGLRYGADIRT